MVADVGDTKPERTPEGGPNRRVSEAILPGGFADVAAFNGQLIALNRSGKQLVLVDPFLSPKFALDPRTSERLFRPPRAPIHPAASSRAPSATTNCSRNLAAAAWASSTRPGKRASTASSP